MSRNFGKIKQKLFDLTVVLLVVAGLTVYAYQKGRLNFNNGKNLPPTPLLLPTSVPPMGPKTYINNDFFYQFDYDPKTQGCTKEITVSAPWVMDNNVYGTDVYCEKDKNLLQIISQKTDTDIVKWWYTLLPDNRSFFEKYGSMKDIVFAGTEAKQISYQKDGENDHFNQTETIFQRDGINYLIVALDYYCSGNQSCWQGAFEQKTLKSFKLNETTNSSPTPAPTGVEGQVCGGIMGRTCPVGFKCEYEGNYPDATGKCSKI